MSKLALVVVLVLGGVATAGSGSGSATGSGSGSGSAARPKCDPFNAMHGCDPSNPTAAKEEVPPPPTNMPAVPQPGETLMPASQMRKICADAMNADPSFKEAIQNSIDKQIDQQVLDAHLDADRHIQKNEKHVIIAYAALWALAALFVVFLWLRQLNLKREIEALRRDLEAAAKETAK